MLGIASLSRAYGYDPSLRTTLHLLSSERLTTSLNDTTRAIEALNTFVVAVFRAINPRRRQEMVPDTIILWVDQLVTGPMTAEGVNVMFELKWGQSAFF